MVEVCSKSIDCHISEPYLHSHNPDEGVIREVMRKMVLYYGKEEGTKETMRLWCKLVIRSNVNDSFFYKYYQWRDSLEKRDRQDY